MLQKIKEILNQHEQKNPHHRHLNEAAINDAMTKHGIGHPSRPLSLHVGYTLDNHHKNQQWAKNFDAMDIQDRLQVDKDILDLAQVAMILHHPDYLEANEGLKFNNVDIAREYLINILNEHGDDEDRIEQYFRQPLLEYLLDQIDDDENSINSILTPNMVHKTNHSPSMYKTLLHANFAIPINEGNRSKNWAKSKLSKIKNR